MKFNVDVFSVGHVAKRCGVCDHTVQKWVDGDKLKAHKLPAGDRRILRADLIKFMTKQGFPLGDLVDGYGVMYVAVPAITRHMLIVRLPLSKGYRYANALNLFAAGEMLGAFQPAVVVIDLSLGRSDCVSMVQHIRGIEAHAGTKIIGLAGEYETAVADLVLAGFNEVLVQPLSIDGLAKSVRKPPEREGR